MLLKNRAKPFADSPDVLEENSNRTAKEEKKNVVEIPRDLFFLCLGSLLYLILKQFFLLLF